MSDIAWVGKPAIARGVWAGFLATVVLSILMLGKHAVGVMPELDPIQMITQILGASTPLVGWVVHFAIGAIWGIAFAMSYQLFPGPFWVKGMLFSIAPWLIMMVAMMPMAGAGMFGVGLGVGAPVLTLMLHLVFGAALGAVYGAGGHDQ